MSLCTQAEKARSDALVQRMSGLLACFPFKGGKKGAKDEGEHDAGTQAGLTTALQSMDDAFGEW